MTPTQIAQFLHAHRCHPRFIPPDSTVWVCATCGEVTITTRTLDGGGVLAAEHQHQALRLAAALRAEQRRKTRAERAGRL